MKIDPAVLEKAEGILSRHKLCNSCLGRQFAVKRGEHVQLAEQIRQKVGTKEPEKCELCEGIIQRTDEIARDVIKALSDYGFKTFQVGASIPSSLLEDEDALRAEFKLRGGFSVKTEITSAVSKIIGKRLRKKFDVRNPDLVIVVNPVERFYTITPRSLFIVARYRKSKRGLPQKRPRCNDCNGRGCPTCLWTGFANTPSVESAISEHLVSIFKAKKVKFSWVGSEDDESLVLGSGRLFYAEIIEPKRRRVSEFHAKLKHGVELTGGSILKERPSSDSPFELVVEANVKTSKPIKNADLRKLGKSFRNIDASQYSPNKMKFLTKRIFSLKAKKVSAKSFKAIIRCRGGTHIKKLIVGNHLEFAPSVSEVLGFECTVDARRPFDVLNVRILKKPIREPKHMAELIAEPTEG